MFADQLLEISDRLAADLRSRNEPAHAEVNEHAALDDLRHGRFDYFVVVVGGDDLLPGLQRARAPFA
jgi:hypothetical protein